MIYLVVYLFIGWAVSLFARKYVWCDPGDRYFEWSGCISAGLFWPFFLLLCGFVISTYPKNIHEKKK